MVVTKFTLEIYSMFLNTCHIQNTQFVLQNVINSYGGDIGNRTYVS